MSKAGDEEDEEERFYESLDRILSSSSSSTSTSDDDDASSPNYSSTHYQNHHHHHHISIPRFPMSVSKYDIWVSEPSSVEERRSRLLHEMGLSRDPSLARSKPVIACAAGDFGRSASSDLLSSEKPADTNFRGGTGMVRSKSDGSRDCDSSPLPHQCNLSSICSSPSILSVNNRIDVVNPRCGNGSPSPIAVSPNKPPRGKNCKRVSDIRSDSTNSYSNPSLNCNSLPVAANGGGEFEEDSDCSGIGRAQDQVCTIKDLDNGKEFVVNELREDGMWNKLKEVGTGRQLTMEEFEMCVGHSPIVQELMRRQNVEEGNNKDNSDSNVNGGSGSSLKTKKKGGWFKSIRNVASSVTGNKERRSSDERDTSSEKGGRRSSSATDDSQDVSFHGPERIRVRPYGKSCKELTALYKSQEIQAHNGSIWSIKFSLDGRYLASAGEDCVIHVWQVMESERKGELLMEKLEDGNLNLLLMSNGSPEPTSISPNADFYSEKKRRGKPSISRKSLSLEQVVVPETVFALSEKPFCSFLGHLDDVLDLSWSKSQHLLSSSMDKTVRLWNLSSQSCLKVFSHSDYVTCIQFNPVDDRYFISGSLDAKVRIWSIPDRQVVDWNDLHEMITAACYTPDGQGALVGSNKGSCRLYNTAENKLQQKSQINLQNKKKKSHQKKITGFQFAPGSSSEVLITSADSRIRVIEGIDLVHKFKGFRNTSSQISASLTANGKYVVCASEDSHVFVWTYEGDSRLSRTKGVTVTRSYEHFHCQDVSVAIPWPGIVDMWELQDSCSGELNGLGNHLDEASAANHPPTPVEEIICNEGSPSLPGRISSPLHGTISSASNSYFFDRISATWPEEKLLLAAKNQSPQASMDFSNGMLNRSAWGLVIVTAGVRGEIRTFQNFGLPVRI
ncbi:uncharacterized protein LOC131147265 [Malania oleifera]|uniref:uncharacterized protein LOC131147265 n=1 Tax=Malania oleifera TaxID=397392 RepID=UPI0025AE94CC|nr:uncharacterized protein LOC131147265 [Malania oleifera]